MTIRETVLLLLMNECNDSLQDAVVLFRTGGKSGCWQIQILETSHNKTIPSSHHGLYRFIRRAFEPRIAPALFELEMQTVASKVKGQLGPVYLDDTTIYSKPVLEHPETVRTVPALLQMLG